MTKTYLTDLTLRRLPFSESGQQSYWDSQLPGFGVKIGRRTKTFMVKHQNRVSTLGRYPNVSLTNARRAAMGVLSQDRTEKRPTKLSEARMSYLMECEQKNRPATVKEYRRMLALIDDKLLDQVKKTDLKNPTSHQIMAWRIFFNWCIKSELTEKNPFQHIPTPVGQRDRVLNSEEVRAIWHWEDPPFTNIVKLLLLTGQRRNQIWKLDPGWIDDDVISFPAWVMKSGKSHQIPIGPKAQNIKPPFAFNGWTKSKARLDKGSGVHNWTLHDLRRTFATIHAELGTPIHIVEAMLNHTSGTISGVAAIYIRADWLREMRAAALTYEAHIATLVGALGNEP